MVALADGLRWRGKKPRESGGTKVRGSPGDTLERSASLREAADPLIRDGVSYPNTAWRTNREAGASNQYGARIRGTYFERQANRKRGGRLAVMRGRQLGYPETL